MKEKKFKGRGAPRRSLPAVIIAAVMVLAAAAVLMPDAETDAATVYYIDNYGQRQLSPTITAEIAAPTDIAAMAPYILNGGVGGGCFYVKDNVFLDNDLTISGDWVLLVIGKNCTLHVEQGVIVNAGTSFYLVTEDPVAGNIGKLYTNLGHGVKLLGNDPVFTNTAIIETASGWTGVYYDGTGPASIINGVTGRIVGGNHGINVTYSETHNYGYIAGNGNYGIIIQNNSVVWNHKYFDGTVTWTGEITGRLTAVASYQNAEVHNSGKLRGQISLGIGTNGNVRAYNDGDISGPVGGISAMGSGFVDNSGIIRGTGSAQWAVRIFSDGHVVNEGTISGAKTGVTIGNMPAGNSVINRATGVIEGLDGDGIYVDGGVGIEVYNYGGYIFGDSNGINLNARGNIFNYDVAGVIEGGNNGIYLKAGGKIHNDGEITGIDSPNNYADLTQYGLISGSVLLCTTTSNNVVFGAGSVIENDLVVGDTGSTLYFVKGNGDTSGLIYATVNGSVTLGLGTASVEDIQGLPAGYSGAEVILIDAFSMSGSPSNNTISLPAPVITLDLWTFDDRQLIAGIPSIPIIVPPPAGYTITSSADSGSTISPSGRVTVPAGGSQTFLFSAKDGFRIASVTIDGHFTLSQAQIDSGSYTFANVMADHTIDVRTVAGSRTDLTLTIVIKEGDGYAEYNTGSGYVRYTGPVSLTEGSNVSVRAIAGDGYMFDRWETPSVSKSQSLSFSDVRASISLDLYFAVDDSGKADDSWITLLLIALLLAALLFLILFFLLWYRRGLYLTIIMGEAVKGAAVTYRIERNGERTKDVKMTNSRGKCRIAAKKGSTVTITMVAKEGAVAEGLPLVVLMKSRKEYREIILK